MAQFAIYLALSGPAWVGATTLALRYRRLYGPDVFVMTTPGGRDELGQPFIVTMDDMKVLVTFVGQPLPQDAYEPSLARALQWDDAPAVLAAQRGYVAIELASEVDEHLQRLNGAAAVTLVAGALIDLLPTVAVLVPHSDVVASPELFAEQAANLAREQIPVELWTSLEFYSDEGRPGEANAGAASRGLAYFIDQELEFEPAPVRTDDIRDRMLELGRYLMLNGNVLDEGENVGFDPEERIRARFAPIGRRAAGPVIQMYIDDTVAREHAGQPDATQSTAETRDGPAGSFVMADESYDEPLIAASVSDQPDTAEATIEAAEVSAHEFVAEPPSVDFEPLIAADDELADPERITPVFEDARQATGNGFVMVEEKPRPAPAAPEQPAHRPPAAEKEVAAVVAQAAPAAGQEERPRPKPMGMARLSEASPAKGQRAFGRRVQ